MSLQSKWIMYFHSIQNNNWGKDSYAILGIAKTVDKVDMLFNFFKENANLRKNMLFWMREKITDSGSKEFIYPTWEDKYNKDGGSICISGDFEIFWKLFLKLISYISGETLYIDATKGYNELNGISFQLRKNGAGTIKLWLRNIPDLSEPPGELAKKLLLEYNEEIRNEINKYDPYLVSHKKIKKKDSLYSEKVFKKRNRRW